MHFLKKTGLLFLLAFAGGPACSASDTAFFYVAKTGTDGAAGTVQKPFSTLEGARNHIRSVRSSLSGRPVVIYVRGGIYYLQNTFELNEKDILPDDAAMCFKAYPGEYVAFNGGVAVGMQRIEKLTGNAADRRFPANARNKIRKINLGKLGITDYGTIRSYGFRRPVVPATPEIFVNKMPMTLARYPNDTGILLQKGPDMQQSVYTTDPKIKTWATTKDVWIGGIFNWAWADDQLPIAAIDPDRGAIRLKEAPMFGFDAGNDYRRWYAFNLPQELDAPDEYYIDREQGFLYFYPPAGKALTSVEISLLTDPMISLSGTQNISFQYITFENMRGMAVYMEQGRNNSFVNCTFRNIGMLAAVLGKGVNPFVTYVHNGTGTLASETVGSLAEHLYDNTATDREAGTNNGLKNCLLYNIGNGGVSLGGGNRKTLTPAANYVQGCSIHHFNRLGKSYRGAVNVDGVGNRIEGNHLYSAGHLAVYLMGNNHSIAANEIDHVCQDVDDMGAVYAGYNPSEAGNIISGNYFHHIIPKKEGYRVAGIFLDDGASGFSLTKNTFFQVGSADFGAICVNGGRGFSFLNNVFIDCPQAIKAVQWSADKWSKTLRSPLWQARLHQAVDIDSKVYTQNYPALSRELNSAVGQSVAQRNLIVNGGVFSNKDLPANNNWITNSNPGFLSTAKADFRLKPDAEAFKRITGFENPQVEKAGAPATRAGNPYDPFTNDESR